MVVQLTQLGFMHWMHYYYLLDITKWYPEYHIYFMVEDRDNHNLTLTGTWTRVKLLRGGSKQLVPRRNNWAIRLDKRLFALQKGNVESNPGPTSLCTVQCMWRGMLHWTVHPDDRPGPFDNPRQSHSFGGHVEGHISLQTWEEGSKTTTTMNKFNLYFNYKLATPHALRSFYALCCFKLLNSLGYSTRELPYPSPID